METERDKMWGIGARDKKQRMDKLERRQKGRRKEKETEDRTGDRVKKVRGERRRDWRLRT